MRPDAPENCTCFNLRKAARAVTQAYDDALKPSGLRATQFSLLVTVAENQSAGVKALAKALGMDRTTLGRNLQVLVNRGLLQTGEQDDRRYRPISLTRAGREALESAMPLWKRVQSRKVQRLGQDRWEGFLGDLNEAGRLP